MFVEDAIFPNSDHLFWVSGWIIGSNIGFYNVWKQLVYAPAGVGNTSYIAASQLVWETSFVRHSYSLSLAILEKEKLGVGREHIYLLLGRAAFAIVLEGGANKTFLSLSLLFYIRYLTLILLWMRVQPHDKRAVWIIAVDNILYKLKHSSRNQRMAAP